MSTLLRFLAVLGPGLVTATVDNDSGGIATYSLAGAQYGYRLLWTLIPVAVVLMITLEMTARLGVYSQKGLSDLVRERFGVRSTAALLLLVLLANIGTVASEFSGIASAVTILGKVAGMSAPWLGKLVLPFFGLLVWAVVIKADYKRLEKVFLLMALFYLTYVFAAFGAKPDWGAAARGLLIPSFVHEPNFIFSMVGMIGTTITPWMNFYLQSTIIEKGTRPEDYALARVDVYLSSLTTCAVAFFITVACAATLWKAGVKVESIEDVGLALVPFAKGHASLLFAVGLFGASLFGAAILPISTSFTICEAMGWEHGVNRRYGEAPMFYITFTTILGLGAAIVMVPGAPLLMIMRASQVAQGLVLPVFLFFLIRIEGDPRILGEHRSPRWLNRTAWVTAVLLSLLSLYLCASPFLLGGR
jgi:NRAMP (natural resistance-associated macrophage protein)-like metal ion transporter